LTKLKTSQQENWSRNYDVVDNKALLEIFSHKIQALSHYWS